MVIRFGAELEQSDTLTKRSVREARNHFLGLLLTTHPIINQKLLQLINYQSVPESVQNSAEITSLILLKVFAIKTKSQKNLPKIERGIHLDREMVETPLLAYLDFLIAHEKTINNLLAKPESDEPTFFSVNFSETLRKVTPVWSVLKTKKGSATKLVKSLEVWGKEFNLTDDWFFDFALKVLREFTVNIYEDIELLKQNLSLETATFLNEKVKTLIQSGNSWMKIIEEEIFYKSAENLSFYIENPVPAFKFEINFSDRNDDSEKNDFLIKTWLPHQQERKEFIDDLEKDFQKKLIPHLAISEQSILSKLTDSITDLRKQASDYTNEVLLLFEENSNKPVVKRNSEHFNWLFEFQVYKKSYIAIAEPKNLDVTSVTEAIKRLASLLDLTLRTSKRTGCPPGIIESHSRHRVGK